MWTLIWTLALGHASVRVRAITGAINNFLKKKRRGGGRQVILKYVIPKWWPFSCAGAQSFSADQGERARPLWVSTLATPWNQGAALQNTDAWVRPTHRGCVWGKARASGYLRAAQVITIYSQGWEPGG